MPFNVRPMFGPVLIAAVVLTAFAVDRQLAMTPDLADIFAGIVVCGAALATALLRASKQRAFDRERARHAAGARLAAALDQTAIGVVLLDADTRAEFINRAFRQMFAVPDNLADSKPPFIALMYHGRDSRIYALPEDELDGFIARRTELIRAGDTTPVDIKLANGQVIRLSCTPLPDSGRMLSYNPITDLIRHDDDPAHSAHYQSLRGSGDVFVGGQLRAAE